MPDSQSPFEFALPQDIAAVLDRAAEVAGIEMRSVSYRYDGILNAPLPANVIPFRKAKRH